MGAKQFFCLLPAAQRCAACKSGDELPELGHRARGYAQRSLLLDLPSAFARWRRGGGVGYGG
eukprot:4596547-Alexandrium_andersonii.AAC.1